MSGLWWMIPVGAIMVWLIIQLFRGGGPPTGGGGDRDLGNASDLSNFGS